MRARSSGSFFLGRWEENALSPSRQMELQHKSPWHSSNIWIINRIHSNNFSSNQSIAFKACGGEPLASSLDAIGTNQILFLNEARIHSVHSSMLLIVYCVITAYHLVVVSTTAHQACPQTTTNVQLHYICVFVVVKGWPASSLSPQRHLSSSSIL